MHKHITRKIRSQIVGVSVNLSIIKNIMFNKYINFVWDVTDKGITSQPFCDILKRFNSVHYFNIVAFVKIVRTK